MEGCPLVKYLRQVESRKRQGPEDFRECQVVMAQAFNLSTREAETVALCEFEASIVYRASSSTDRTPQRNMIFREHGFPG